MDTEYPLNGSFSFSTPESAEVERTKLLEDCNRLCQHYLSNKDQQYPRLQEIKGKWSQISVNFDEETRIQTENIINRIDLTLESKKDYLITTLVLTVALVALEIVLLITIPLVGIALLLLAGAVSLNSSYSDNGSSKELKMISNEISIAMPKQTDAMPKQTEKAE